MVTTLSSPDVKVRPEVFINFRGAELRNNFISQLHSKLRSDGINAFIDSDESPGQQLSNIFQRIKESKIALAVLSSRYTESHWCLEELVTMKECSMRGEGCNNNLLVIPIFYKLDPSTVEQLDGDFGLNLWNLWRSPGPECKRDSRIVKWNEALQDVVNKKALVFTETGKEDDFLSKIVAHVKEALDQIWQQSRQNPEPQTRREGGNPNTQRCLSRGSNNTEPEEKRLKQLEEKLDVECNDNETRIVGVVGMPGIGKTYLAEKLFDELKMKIGHCVFIKFEREMSNEQGSTWLQQRLVEGLLNQDCDDENALQIWKNRQDLRKIVVILDNVFDKEHIEPLLGNLDWVKEGSRIVITTGDKYLLKELDCNIYEVPGLNDTEGLELFRAQIGTTLEGNFLELSRKFVDFAGGNPLALKAFGEELKGKDEDHWRERLGTLTQCSNEKIKRELSIPFDELNEEQKDAFLDIAYFFRSQGEEYVRALLDSESPQAEKDFRGLVDKFLISVSDGRVEMHELFFTMAKELAETSGGKYWLFPSNFAGSSTDALKTKQGKQNVRGIILDMSKMKQRPLDRQAFVGMGSLRYLKVYYSLCPRQCEVKCMLNLPDGIEFPKHNLVRYLDWIVFPGKQLPSDFEPKTLIDLRLPNSEITSIWNCEKATPKLKWVDLSHSTKLLSISSLSDAPNLLKLNLESCTSLEKLPAEMENMKKLVYLNLRGCTRLWSLPNITMDSLKTLILSGCSELKSFEVISEHLETLYLNGTAIVGLPSAFGNLHSLRFLNLKDCKDLVTLPVCLGALKSLQELKLSRCSKLNIFPDVVVENLRVLLLDGTSITEMPRNISGLSLLRRLCLSGNENIRTLQFDMGQMFHMKWLDLKYCKNLISLRTLPPNLLCLNAHGCTSLKNVDSPLALLIPTEQIHSIFIFTNCHKLEQVSKNVIISYIQKKSELMSDDRHNQGFVFKSLIGTCFPGCEVPAWFNYQACGSVLELELPREWNECRFFRIALCAVVSFKECKDQNNSLQVKCTCEFTNESFTFGGWSEQDDELYTVKSEHVFTGYTTWFSLKKRQQLSSTTEVSLRFEVANGTSAVAECEVMKCGFSLIYEPEQADNTSWEANQRMENSILGQSVSFNTDEGCPSVTPTTADANRVNNFFNFFVRRVQ